MEVLWPGSAYPSYFLRLTGPSSLAARTLHLQLQPFPTEVTGGQGCAVLTTLTTWCFFAKRPPAPESPELRVWLALLLLLSVRCLFDTCDRCIKPCTNNVHAYIRLAYAVSATPATTVTVSLFLEVVVANTLQFVSMAVCYRFALAIMLCIVVCHQVGLPEHTQTHQHMNISCCI